ncbi:hypothetical protein HDU97_002716 [Phlyctochytrium planicorne]|nr:hypothetical protein HDU97_002716 [Phlyctochytrium planicorne]
MSQMDRWINSFQKQASNGVQKLNQMVGAAGSSSPNPNLYQQQQLALAQQQQFAQQQQQQMLAQQNGAVYGQQQPYGQQPGMPLPANPYATLPNPHALPPPQPAYPAVGVTGSAYAPQQPPLPHGQPPSHPQVAYTGAAGNTYAQQPPAVPHGQPTQPYGQQGAYQEHRLSRPPSVYSLHQAVAPQPYQQPQPQVQSQPQTHPPQGFGYAPVSGHQAPLPPVPTTSSPYAQIPGPVPTPGGRWMCRNPKHHSHANSFTNPQTTHDGFISYRVSTDAAIASKLQTKLEERGHTVFLDSGCLHFGQDWEDGFLKGLQTSRHIFYLISEASLRIMKDKLARGEKDNVLTEMERGLDCHHEGKVIAVPIFVSTYNPITGVRPLGFRIIDEVGAGDARHVASGRLVRDTLGAMMKLNGVVHKTIIMTGQEIFQNFLDRGKSISPFIPRDFSDPAKEPVLQEALDVIQYYKFNVKDLNGAAFLDPLHEKLENLEKEELARHGNNLKVDPTMALILTILGEVQFIQGKTKEARSNFEESLRILHATFGSGYIADTKVLIQESYCIGPFLMLSYADERFDECEALGKRALQLYEHIHGTRLHTDANITLFLLALSYTKLKRYDEAMEYFEDCLIVSHQPAHKGRDPAINLVLLEIAKCEGERENWAEAERRAMEAKTAPGSPEESRKTPLPIAQQADAFLLDLDRKKRKKAGGDAPTVSSPVSIAGSMDRDSKQGGLFNAGPASSNGSRASYVSIPSAGPAAGPAAGSSRAEPVPPADADQPYPAPSAALQSQPIAPTLPPPQYQEFDHSVTETLANLAIANSNTGSSVGSSSMASQRGNSYSEKSGLPPVPGESEKKDGWELEVRQKIEVLIGMVGGIASEESRMFERDEVVANLDRMMKAVAMRNLPSSTKVFKGYMILNPTPPAELTEVSCISTLTSTSPTSLSPSTKSSPELSRIKHTNPLPKARTETIKETRTPRFKGHLVRPRPVVAELEEISTSLVSKDALQHQYLEDTAVSQSGSLELEVTERLTDTAPRESTVCIESPIPFDPLSHQDVAEALTARNSLTSEHVIVNWRSRCRDLEMKVQKLNELIAEKDAVIKEYQAKERKGRR